MVTFLLLILTIGVAYILITFYFTSKYFEETTQKLNAEVANHLIEEKFKDASPFLADGLVNKPLFGDIMHDMMAVNRGIEVYLLDKSGNVQYSVVLDHSDTDKPLTRLDTLPINAFINCSGKRYILGDDPRNPENKKIFSAAPFNIDGNEQEKKGTERVNNQVLSNSVVRIRTTMQPSRTSGRTQAELHRNSAQMLHVKCNEETQCSYLRLRCMNRN